MFLRRDSLDHGISVCSRGNKGVSRLVNHSICVILASLEVLSHHLIELLLVFKFNLKLGIKFAIESAMRLLGGQF